MTKFMKTIQITADVRIVASPTDWCVELRKTVMSGKRKGEDDWEFNGSYPSPRAAALSLVNGRNVKLLVADAPERMALYELIACVEVGIRTVEAAIDRAGIS